METRPGWKEQGPSVKPIAEPIGTKAGGRTSIREKSGAPAVLGRTATKDPARELARMQARDQGLKPTRSSGQISELDQVADSKPKRPSRASRSMKSRQSDPKRGKSGRKKVVARKTIKPPLVLMGFAAVIIVIALILLPKTYQPSSQNDAAQVRVNASTVRPDVSAQLPSISTSSISTSSIIGSKTTSTPKYAMNLTSANRVQLGQVVAFRQGIPPVIEFRDGSRMNVDPVTLEQLPADVRLQLTYSRGRQ
jgi:hypothetical protein